MTRPDETLYPHRVPKEHEETVEISAEELREIIESGERGANNALVTFRRLRKLLNGRPVKAPVATSEKHTSEKRRPPDEANQT